MKRRAKRRRIAGEGGAPVFSPSGRRVLYEVFSNPDRNTLGSSFLVTVTPRGKRVRVIYSSDGSTGATLADPAWQPRPGGG